MFITGLLGFRYATQQHPSHSSMYTRPDRIQIRSIHVASALLETVLFPLVEQVRLCRAQIHNLWTPVPILLENGALFAVIRVRDALAAAHDATALERAIVALVAYAHEGARPHIRVADGTLPVALYAQTPDRCGGTRASVWVLCAAAQGGEAVHGTEGKTSDSTHLYQAACGT